MIAADLILALAALLATPVAPATSVPAEAAQQAAPEAAPRARPEDGPADGWLPVDSVMLVINEEIITSRRFARELTQLQSMGGISTQRERQELVQWLMFEKVRRKVMVQAGQDMGLDPRLVERQVDDVLEREIESSGGVEEYVERVKKERSDSHERRDQLTDELYRITWEQVQTGESPGVLGRPTHDRYVRPGLRRFVYAQVVDTPAWYGEFGGNAPGVEFQELVVSHARHGGVEAARAVVDEVRKQALNGSDFDGLMRAFGEPRADGLMTRADEALVAEVDRTLGKFLAGAQPGDVSEVYVPRNGRMAAFAVTRFVRRVEAVVPSFEEPEVQLTLDKRTRENIDLVRRNRALERLLEAAYVWPPEARRPEPEDPNTAPADLVPAPARTADPAPGAEAPAKAGGAAAGDG